MVRPRLALVTTPSLGPTSSSIRFTFLAVSKRIFKEYMSPSLYTYLLIAPSLLPSLQPHKPFSASPAPPPRPDANREGEALPENFLDPIPRDH
ncbi:hypothetical protein CDAR_95281 [Caerostris darwini]|uniref:Uncharacterized protein n=1 Tax=Caerostris darwini TaxID=1538125 RepID=A0AAV4PHV1_9ARAC|nr:hypothetical protein CDAR_95281 [Caerostris darwini]